MLIQIHQLQNYAPSNLNRDDTGAPKDTTFGGVRRGRISSQAIKRSIRRSVIFDEAFARKKLLATRTKRLPKLVSDHLQSINVAEEDRLAIAERALEIGQESTKKGKEKVINLEKAETRQLIFLGADEVQRVAEALLAVYQEKGAKGWKSAKIDEITSALEGRLPRSVDIAMFGRMTTSQAFEDVQAAVQVAHAISTNALANEFDFFTAVDDLSGDSGAGMLGDIEFNSSTYYKYFNIHWEALVENLGGDSDVALQAVLALLEASAMAHPSGKQNSFAAHNLPDFVLVEINPRNIPVSYANAFIKPTKQKPNTSLMQESVADLNQYATTVRKKYGLNTQRGFISMVADVKFDKATEQDSLSDLGVWIRTQIQGATNE